MAGNTVIFFKYIELRIYPDPFCTSCQIYSTNKRLVPKTHLNQRHLLNDFIEIIPEMYSKRLTSETKFSGYLLVADA